ncbi:MFS transporter [Deinococcus aquiradiocola]|uniref:Major facilitator superfamily (MFS) profile domain-containing protein n=1 Tax=Deinococcus aquiradiocola TaxID=393059 RepID=A0A917UPR4_9DEIO|nr:MFS transporter [Deinococcus aquiradiocola]GGJ73864.1 hypothetical protein GCM10008939_17700 [Deinococcus aquiradiocola]
MTRPRLILYALGFLSFLLFGLVQAGYGPAYPNLGREFLQSPTAVGLIASLHFAGSAVGTLLLGALLTRLSLRSGLTVAALLLLAGLLGVALSPAWGLVLAGAAVSGLGYGMLSAGFNMAFAELGPGPSNLVNGLFGVGSVVSPTLVTLLGQASHRPPFLLMAVMAAALALGVRLLWPRPEGQAGVAEPDVPVPAAPDARPAVAHLPTLALFGCCFFLYVGIEAGLGNWATTYLTRLGSGQAALQTSFYWLALTAGRFASAALGNRVRPMQVLTFAATGAMLGCLLMLRGLTLAPLGLIVAGFCIAPIFSTQLAWFTRRQPAHLAPYMLTLGSVGGAVLPAVTGVLLPRFGPASVPGTVFVIAALLLFFASRVRRVTAAQAA